MTKSTDKSLIEDTEIASDDLVEGLAGDEDASDIDDDTAADLVAVVDDDDDDDDSDEDEDGKKFVDRRKPAEDRRKTLPGVRPMLIRHACILKRSRSRRY